MLDSALLSTETAMAAGAAASTSKAAALTQSKNMSTAQIDKAAVDFEAMFLSQMMKPMFETIQQDTMFGGGQAEEMYKGLMVEEYGKVLARTGGVGIADEVRRAMLDMQDVRHEQQATI